MDHKTKKFDRQLRIWGHHGQEALESARVLLLNASATGSEVLKNLVLGNIGSFTVVDGATVTARDLGNNFLVDGDSLGKRRAAVVTSLLRELNDSVDGKYVDEDPEGIIGNLEFFKDFTLVVATQLPEQQLLRVDEACRSLGIPLLALRSYGLMGLLRCSYGELCILETKPENTVEDLRLHSPWPALERHALSYDLGSLDDVLHKHVPYAIVLIQAAHAFREARGHLPGTPQEKRDFKELVVSMERRAEPGVPSDEENFKEALQHAHRVWAPADLSSDVRSVLNDPKTAVGPQSSSFWFLVAALRAFMEGEGQGTLPLEGSIPDMTATTEMYLALQRVYRDKALEDTAALERHVGALLTAAGRDPSSIPKEAIKSFAKHCRHMKVVRSKPLADEFLPQGSPGPTHSPSSSPSPSPIRQSLSDEDKACSATMYILLRAADRFLQQHGWYPGADASQMDDDVAKLKELTRGVISDGAAGGLPLMEDMVAEFGRFGACELHCVAAVMGGVGAQEAIKLITGQFVPVDRTLVYDAIHGKMTSLDA